MASLICAGCHLFSGFRLGKVKNAIYLCWPFRLAAADKKRNNAILSVLASTDKMASVLREPLGFCKECNFICAAMQFYLCCDTILIGLADDIHPFWSQCARFHVEAKASMPFHLCCDAILSVLAFWLGFRAQALESKNAMLSVPAQMPFYLCCRCHLCLPLL